MLGNYTQLPWALLLQYIIFGETMDFLSCIGALIIMGSTIWVVLTKQKEKAAKGVVASDTDVERNAGLVGLSKWPGLRDIVNALTFASLRPRNTNARRPNSRLTCCPTHRSSQFPRQKLWETTLTAATVAIRSGSIRTKASMSSRPFYPSRESI